MLPREMVQISQTCLNSEESSLILPISLSNNMTWKIQVIALSPRGKTQKLLEKFLSLGCLFFLLLASFAVQRFLV